MATNKEFGLEAKSKLTRKLDLINATSGLLPCELQVWPKALSSRILKMQLRKPEHSPVQHAPHRDSCSSLHSFLCPVIMNGIISGRATTRDTPFRQANDRRRGAINWTRTYRQHGHPAVPQVIAPRLERCVCTRTRGSGDMPMYEHGSGLPPFVPEVS